MHQIADRMTEHHCFFTPFFDDGWMGEISKKGWLDFTILGGKHRKNTENYLRENQLPVDEGGQFRMYDLVVTCTDLLLPKRIRGKKLVLVQEGMVEPEGLLYHMVQRLKLPRFLANTASTGLSHAYDLFCVASQGYRNLFVNKGVRPEKIVVTGIPNFDHVHQYLENDFPHHHHVLAATSGSREVFKRDDRISFLHKVRKIAAGRKLIIKLHPNENTIRARKEIERHAPEAILYESGDINPMIANCDVLVTQTSSVTFIGLALNKEVYSDLDLNQLRRLLPVQNEGTSGQKIAYCCQQILDHSAMFPVSKQNRLVGVLPQGNAIDPI
jgi:hypothetical protein